MSVWEDRRMIPRIYALEADGVVFYVGLTHRPLSSRLKNHLSASRRPKFPVAHFIASLDTPVSIRGLEYDEWCTKRWGSGQFGREAQWVRHFEETGAELMNIQFSKKDMRILANRCRLEQLEMPGGQPDIAA